MRIQNYFKRKAGAINGIALSLICIGLVGVVACSDEAAEVEVEEDLSSKEWTLVFEEEFDEDLSQWNPWNSGAFNEEIQLYTEDQVELADGLLTIYAQRKASTGPTHPWDNTPKNFQYVSGRIESKTFFGPSNSDGEKQYRFMARLRLPLGAGMWPAFWTYGDPWPTHGEIDILEARGGTPNTFISNLFYGNEPNVNINRGNVEEHSPGPDLTVGFHEYEMIWKETSIDILFDGELLHTYETSSTSNIDKMFGKDQKVVLNTAVGGQFFSDRNANNYADSSAYQIDWVRVYKR